MNLSEQELENWVENARHWVYDAKKGAKPGEDASRIVGAEADLAKALFGLGRFYYQNQQYTTAIPLFKEAHDIVGPSLESSYFLMHCLSELGKWDEAYEMFLISREHGYAGYKHPLYDDPEITLAPLKGLGQKVTDHCSRIHNPVTPEEYQNWHWNKRFKSLNELIMIAGGYYPPASNIEVAYHPFEFRPYDRIFQFHGLADKGVPFKFDNEHNLAVDSRYPVKIKYLLTTPQSREDKEDYASWLEVILTSPFR